MNYVPLMANLDPRLTRPPSRLTDATDVLLYGYLDNGQTSGNQPTLSYVNSYLIR